MRKCVNCKWDGEQAVGPLSHCPICGDNTVEYGVVQKVIEPQKSPVINLDLNKDGKVDKSDKVIAAKVLAAGNSNRRRK